MRVLDSYQITSITPAWAKVIERFEGRRLKAYRDIAGILTIGCGHTSMAGAPIVVPGLTITDEQCDAIFLADSKKVTEQVIACISRPLGESDQHHLNAMVSLVYNIGIGGFKSSSVLKYFNRGKTLMAGDAFLAWNKAGGKVVQALVDRRKAERMEFLFSGGAASLPATAIQSEPVFGEMPQKVDNPHTFLQRAAARAELAVSGIFV